MANYKADHEIILELCKTTAKNMEKLAVSVLLFFVFRVVKYAASVGTKLSSDLLNWAHDVNLYQATTRALMPSSAGGNCKSVPIRRVRG